MKGPILEFYTLVAAIRRRIDEKVGPLLNSAADNLYMSAASVEAEAEKSKRLGQIPKQKRETRPNYVPRWDVMGEKHSSPSFEIVSREVMAWPDDESESRHAALMRRAEQIKEAAAKLRPEAHDRFSKITVGLTFRSNRKAEIYFEGASAFYSTYDDPTPFDPERAWAVFEPLVVQAVKRHLEEVCKNLGVSVPNIR